MFVRHSSTPSVNAGEKITKSKHGTSLGGRGTAGLIVRRKGTSTGAYVLTCAHVLGTPSNDDAINQVYSPEFSEASGCECNRPFGRAVPETQQPSPDDVVQARQVFGAESFAVDAALVALEPQADARNEAPKIGTIAATRDLIAEWSLTTAQSAPVTLSADKQILVRKYGASTKYTEGNVRRLIRQKVIEFGAGPPVVTDGLVMEIEANQSQSPFEEEYELDMPRFASSLENITKVEEVLDLFKATNITATRGGSTATPTLKVVGRVFSQRGDSGAPVVDKDNRIVGILASGNSRKIFVKGQAEPVEIHTDRSQVIFIRAALEKLGVDLLPAGQHTAGAPVIVPGRALERDQRWAVDWAAFEAARAAIEHSAHGARLASIFRRHFDEVRQLVHHRRRVTVTWQRSKGPGFLVAVARASLLPEWPVAQEIDGVRLVDALRALRNVLLAEGSPALRTAILDHEAELFALAQHATSVGAVLAELSDHAEIEA
jgi:hypothetical protein